MTEPGIYDVTADEYHGDPCEEPSLTASIAKLFTTHSPLHAWTAHPRLNPEFARKHDDDKFDIGTAAHALLLQGEKVAHVVEAADWRKKDAQEVRRAARANGLIPLLTHEWERVLAMTGAIREQLAALDIEPPLLSDGKPEQMLVWRERGVLCRALVDWLRDDRSAIDDLKTTIRSANPAPWTRSTLWAIGADIQVVFNLRGLKAVAGVDAEFRYIVAETSPPYAVSVISLAPSALALANDKVDRVLDRWKHCLAENAWPAYPQSVIYAETPPWVENAWMEQDAEVLLS